MIEIDTVFLTATIDNNNFGRHILKVFEPGGGQQPLSATEKWRILRKVRNDLLDRIDLTYCNAERWETLTATQKTKIRAIKQHLRDIPELFASPEEVTIPEISA